MSYRILIVDDEPAITSALNYQFTQAGYETVLAHNGREALEKLADEPDLVILDIMLPDIDGYAICKQIRKRPQYIPILMLTAKDTLQEKVIGLDLGADAYLTKPYNLRELLAQVRALFRLAKQQERSKLVCGPIELWLDDGIVCRDGKEVALTTTEFELLSLLMQRQGQVFGRETLLRNIWGGKGCRVNTRTIDTHVQRLRTKIEENPKNPELLITVRGFGYRLVCPNA
ncbi:Two-component transcriptional response regulator, LuxR family [hydrothermal vent metagenome]|uniref:Two-component transcriptional response regulator, LuxR family n=1 Tax=hydrothermal vent metagenome TaxID=652676 RepID=A0A3B0UK22_9ZZZZ